MKYDGWFDTLQALTILGKEYRRNGDYISRYVNGIEVEKLVVRIGNDFNHYVYISKEITNPKNKLTVEIYGKTGSGKSTLALFIQKCLEKYKADVMNTDDEYIFIDSVYKERDISEVISHMAVEIKTTQINRSS